MTGCPVLTKHKRKPWVGTQNSKWAVLETRSCARARDNKTRRGNDDDVDLPLCTRRARRTDGRDRENGCCSGTRDSISVGKIRVKNADKAEHRSQTNRSRQQAMKTTRSLVEIRQYSLRGIYKHLQRIYRCVLSLCARKVATNR